MKHGIYRCVNIDCVIRLNAGACIQPRQGRFESVMSTNHRLYTQNQINRKSKHLTILKHIRV